ncbi:Scd6-like Sm domain-containing protein [Helicostylum pulchrum]|nr:Scd6-like Sm domain-containing protein [Helicostylum pulchrum]
MSGQNYIGSKISLISLSDIRYVGVLHNINSAESTVALQNVQSFGTEGRKASINEEIAPSDNIFDYVVFRGSDIKDLQVFEAPPSYKPVVQQNMSTPVPSANNYYYNQQRYAPYATQSYGNYWQNGNTTAQSQMQMPVPENYQDQKSLKVNDNDFSKNKQEEKTVVVSPPIERRGSIYQEKQEVLNVVIEDENFLVDSLVKQVSDLDIKKASPKVSKSVKEKANKKDKQKSMVAVETVSVKTSRSTTRSTRSTTSSSRGGNNRNRSHGNHNGNNTIVPRSDFDFASANAKFDKTEITVIEKDNTTSKGADSISEPEHFYNKSFFDDISCDSKESNKGRRVKYQEECKLNLETFGQTNTSQGQNSKRHRHRGRDRGRNARERENKPHNDNNAEIVKEST